jgi:hypothetical protein
MDMNNTPRSNPQEVASENVSGPGGPSRRDERQARLLRIDEYELEGLANPDSDRSFLTIALANLFRDVCDLEDEAKQAFMSLFAGETLTNVDGAVTCYLAVTRRIVQLTQLEIRANSVRRFDPNC